MTIDRKGKKCEKCRKGKYQEMYLLDDLNGVLHCNKCLHLIIRHYETQPDTPVINETVQNNKITEEMKQKEIELQKMLDPDNKSFKKVRLIQDALLLHEINGGSKQTEEQKDKLINFISEVLK